MPTLALATILGADGILTHDKDIGGMGGKPISIRFVAEAKDYSRKSAVRLSIQIGGYGSLALTVTALEALLIGIKQAVSFVAAMPTHMKLLLVACLTLLVLSPKTRAAAVDGIKKVSIGVSTAFPEALDFLTLLIKIAEENRVEPPALAIE